MIYLNDIFPNNMNPFLPDTYMTKVLHDFLNFQKEGIPWPTGFPKREWVRLIFMDMRVARHEELGNPGILVSDISDSIFVNGSEDLLVQNFQGDYKGRFNVGATYNLNTEVLSFNFAKRNTTIIVERSTDRALEFLRKFNPTPAPRPVPAPGSMGCLYFK